jgi:hypothetical protein
MSDVLGTVKTEFNKYWIHVNPDAAKGPNTWDVAAIPYAPDGCVNNIIAVLPIEVTQTFAEADLGFSIVKLPLTTGLNRLSSKAAATTALKGSSAGPHPRTVCITDITGELPVKTINVNDRVSMYFEIIELQMMSAYPDWDTDGGLPYNKTRNLNGVTGNEPLVAELVGDTVDVSFNINSLPDI